MKDMKLFFRENYLSKMRGFYNATDLIKVITGIRRCGKSCIMQMIAEELILKGVPEGNIVFINLDKRGFRNITTQDKLDELIYSLTKDINGVKYLFIDEIQNVRNFETVINGFREESDYSIFITGSNSYLLSGELATKLTGRYVSFEIFPLTFGEYIKMKEFYNISVSSNLNEEFENYANEGGFPRTVFFDNASDKRDYVKELVNEIFEKDIKRRIIIRKKETFNLVRDYLINNYGSTTSINNILKELNKSGFVISKATLLKYVRVLVEAKILYECKRFDMKSKKIFSGEKKYYIADLSLSFVTNPDSSLNFGQILENMVYIYSRFLGYEPSVGRIGKLECDFILKDKFLNYSYVQVAYLMLHSKDTEDREYRPLENIKDNYPKYILTDDELIQKRNGIKHFNVLKFMLSEERF